MSNRVLRLHSTLEVPLEELHEYFEDDPDYPEGIVDVEFTRRKNTILISAVAAEDVGKYTPTAQLKATVTDSYAFAEAEAEESGVQTGPAGRTTGPKWSDDPDDEEPQKPDPVEVAGFKGSLDTVLQNTVLQYEMFVVLCDLAREAALGELTAITEVDGELHATRIVDGSERPASVEVVETDNPSKRGPSVDWQGNKYIH
ncbi:hypothetical protein ACFQH6_06185 [Halobacteriaceae archaeon GCM10025711]